MIYTEEDFTYLLGYYSDFHKDVYGFRPRWHHPDFEGKSLTQRIRAVKSRIAGVQATLDSMSDEELREAGWE